jgi:hypothetical protein
MPEAVKQSLALHSQPISGLFGALDNAAVQRIPPQVLLVYSGMKKAYGRQRLKDLGFNVSLRYLYRHLVVIFRKLVTGACEDI